MRINVKGVIVPNDEAWIYDLFDIEHTTPNSVSESIQNANGEDLEVIVNSGGGSVHDASEIYTELKSYSGDVDIQIVGLAASAASVIAMAGTRIKMAPTAEMMIHNSSAIAMGDHRDMNKVSDMLKSTDKTIANAYRLKTGMDEDELLNLMAEETWLTPQDAKEKGLVDEVMFDESAKLSASTSVQSMIPQSVIDGIRKGKLDKNNSAHVNIDKDAVKEALSDFKDEIKEELQNKDDEPVKNDWLF